MDQDEHRYQEEVTTIIRQSPRLMDILTKAHALALPDWYIGSGSVFQTIWNHKHGFEPNHGIVDYDLVYFDPDTSYEAEDVYIKQGASVFDTVPVEIRNQARVPLWFKNHFGVDLPTSSSIEEAMSRWMCSCTPIGARIEPDGQLSVFAAYGLHDVLHMHVRPNRFPWVTQDIYEKKTTRWKQHWPLLTVEPW